IFAQTEPTDPKPVVPDNFNLDDYLRQKGIQLMTTHQAQDVLGIEQATEDIDQLILQEQQSIERGKNLTVEQVRRDMGLPPLEPKRKKKPVVEEEPPQIVQMSIPVQEDEGELLYNRTRILGVAFKTYIILEIDDKLILVDQHAAHERILFDQFMKHRDQKFQDLLFPYVFNVTDEEEEFISKNLLSIEKAGFKVESFGKNTYRIVAVSPLLADVQLSQFVDYLLGSVDELKLDEGEFLVEKIASRACKAAIKAGYTPNKYEITYILKHVMDGSVLTCPHGRPITTIITKTDLEKMFKRRV
ncbi:MAG: hypothetical protein IJX23_02225, partial [Clostridia bacterium]|nr:hypothetical protein [Clostridia bacterium]